MVLFDWMTPDERRGAVVLAGLLLLGAAWDALRVPVPGPEAPPPPAAATAPPTTAAEGPPARLDLNSATVPELDALPGLGPVLAGRIVARRAAVGRFRHVEEVLAVQGVGPRLFERIRSRLRVAADTPGAMQSAPESPQRRADSASAPVGRLR